ncbi:hypothetical protein [Streptacidiphilus albus]|uniref:hypothetical protein n=1 Tax=Streptacidiphilus albus TaxID=105425 RepID=UPI00068A04CB|nr:hypothetical protein [Streptacidiphilus albus]
MRHTIGEFGPGPGGPGSPAPGPGATDGAQHHGYDGHPLHRPRLHGTRAYTYDGSEPSLGHGDYPARRLLAGSFSAIFVIGTVVFSLLAAHAAPGANPGRTLFVVYAVICVVALAVALLDLAVIHRHEAAAQHRTR